MTAPDVVLIFDGDCGFCTSAANTVVRRSRVSVRAVAWQLTDVSVFGLTEADTQRRVYIVTGNDETGFRTFGGHLAFAQLLAVQPNRGLRLLGRLLNIVPFRWFGAIGYSLVARYRHRLPGGTPACALNTADESKNRHN